MEKRPNDCFALPSQLLVSRCFKPVYPLGVPPQPLAHIRTETACSLDILQCFRLLRERVGYML